MACGGIRNDYSVLSAKANRDNNGKVLVIALTLIPAARSKNRAAFVKMRDSQEQLARKFWKNLYGLQIVLFNFLIKWRFLCETSFFYYKSWDLAAST